MSDSTDLLPYDEPRNLDQDAWLLYATTSIEYYELCAQRCEEFAHFFNKLVTDHSAHGMPKVDYWVSRYLNHAENIRRGIGFIKTGGDHMPMLDFLRSPAADYRGLIENGFGYDSRDEWQGVFERLSYACGSGATTLKNNEWKGMSWLDRGSLGSSQELLDRDDGPKGSADAAIAYGAGFGVFNPPPAFPIHPIDRSIHAKPGERCPRTGVWVPAQWADDGALNYSVAFCVEGRPMQAAYRIAGMEKQVMWEADPDAGLPESALYYQITKAEDTTWYFVHKPEPRPHSAGQPETAPRLRCEAHHPCPREGWWFTPAKVGSRRHFKHGERMPEFKSDYGMTIWQWDRDQSA